MAEPCRTTRLVAARVRRELKARGIKISDFASQCGMTQGHLSELLQPRCDWQMRTTEKIANSLGVTVSDLTDGAMHAEAAMATSGH